MIYLLLFQNTQDLFTVPRLRYEPDGKTIPAGYAVVDVRMDNCFPLSQYRRVAVRRNIPRWFLHQHLKDPTKPFFSGRPRSLYMGGTFRDSNFLYDFIVRTSNRSETSHGCIELIPLDVKKELSQNILFRSLWTRGKLCFGVCY